MRGMPSNAPAPPSVPVGPTTVASLATLLVGIIVSVLSLSGVVVDDATTQQIGALVGAVLALAPLIASIFSRGSQAKRLVENAYLFRDQDQDVKGRSTMDYEDETEDARDPTMVSLHRVEKQVAWLVENAREQARRGDPSGMEAGDVREKIA